MLYVKKSLIHGKGLFTQEIIKKGTLLGYAKVTPTKKDGTHVVWISDTEVFLIKDNFKYMNHKSKPNAEFSSDFSIVASRCIKKDEEITINYDGT